MRQGELLGLTWPNVDLRRRIATLADTKCGEGRSVPLSRRAVTALELLPRRLDGTVFPQASATSVSHRLGDRARHSTAPFIVPGEGLKTESHAQRSPSEKRTASKGGCCT